jgi:hypothetical protein
VEENLKLEEAYSPLQPGEIVRLGAPPAPRMDAYLKSRLGKFKLQLEVGGS